ncbi:cell wall-active antibiotics response protein [Alicyclobacillus cycloheptanicus]|uniref:Lia operon protein LiaF n=1 Tax=Alicyclobacillus cycloheptanicus TaxID=1457 RepID=A0ABT9XGL0_9BACL|nr:cell wall-active antibiotics response protein LiaF [Alicyclobacillus cycloheptanicus]MDQ0189199.1 lia operon protein LiaF [Alicyclobacillus cycloheptanicus]WDM00385.1 cell wall-active antibiotics response protein [Alicyclobacillus cycloheptanicus]
MRRGAGFGIVLIAVGVVYLLTQAGVIHMASSWWSGRVLWPLVLVVLGGSGLKAFSRGRIPWGSLYLVVLGLLLAAKGTHAVPWLNPVSGWTFVWGLLLIFCGLYFLTPRRLRGIGDPLVVVINRRSSHAGAADAGANDAEASDAGAAEFGTWTAPKRHSGPTGHRAQANRRTERRYAEWRLIGDVSIGHEPWVLSNVELWNGVGDIRVNLATALVEDGDYHLNVGGWVGDVRILVPEDLDVAIDAEIRVGDLQVFGEKQAGSGRRVHMEDPGYAASTRRCRIDVSLQIGEVQIVRV